MIYLRVLVPLAILAASWQSYHLTRTPQLGQQLRYRLTANIDVIGDTTTITAQVVETVTAVEGGKFTIDSIQTKAHAKSGTLERDLPDSEKSSAVYSLSGEPLEIKAGNDGGIQGRLARMNAVIMPEKEVKVGDKWNHTYPGSTFSGGVGGKADFKALSVERVEERIAVVIQIDYKENAKSKPASSSGRAWIDAENGELLKLEMAWKNSAMFSADAPMDATITLVRIK